MSSVYARALCGMIGWALVGCSAPTMSDIAPVDAADTRLSKDELRRQFQDALQQAQQTVGPGKPPIWTLSDEDTVIHFFGTVHLLRPELNWRSPAFDEAFASSDTLVVEIDMTSEAAQASLLRDFVQRGMYQNGETLRAALNEADEEVVEAAFDSVGVPLNAMNTFEPWLAAVNLSNMKLQADGYDPGSGVESVLEAEARRDGKELGYLEEISDQADAFDGMSPETQIEFLYETAILLDDSPQMLDQLVAEWADGDITGIGVMVASPEGVGYSREAYDALLVNRNARWVPRIEDMLDTPGTIFIAVGAGHLAGPDSVIEMLRGRGHEIVGP